MNRVLAIKEHLKMLISLRSNWDWIVGHSSGFFNDKVKLITRNGELLLTKTELELYIKQTKSNLKRKLNEYKKRINGVQQ